MCVLRGADKAKVGYFQDIARPQLLKYFKAGMDSLRSDSLFPQSS